MELEETKEHIKTLSADDWNRLFILIPEIEQETVYGEFDQAPLSNGSPNLFYPWKSSVIVHKIENIITELSLAPVYDWINWTEGREVLGKPNTLYDSLDTISLCKLFTIMIRQDRFCDGYFISCFENGAMLKVLKALKAKVSV